jgi:hypothetical protein
LAGLGHTQVDPAPPIGGSIAAMHRNERTPPVLIELKRQLPRVLVLLGLGLFVTGLIATIAFVTTDSGCNAATNLQMANSLPAGSSFCGHEHGFLTLSFLTFLAGAGLIILGGMVLPTLRSRDARIAAAKSQPKPED